MRLGKREKVTLTQVLEARFSDDPAVQATATDLARLYFFQQEVVGASFEETVARARLSTAELEMQFKRSPAELFDTLGTLQALVEDQSNDIEKLG